MISVEGQVCSGTLGEPVINIDFGRGTNNIGSPINETDYTFIPGNPNDGQYTVVKTSAGLNGGWHQNVVNHTPNDANGYFMLVNANVTKGVFYQTTINNLCPNTTYEFAAWIINILRNSGIKPNVRFTIEAGEITKTFTTNDIAEGSATDWIKYGTIFTTPANVGTVTLRMTNENPGGSGNDLALDDITFRPCGPTITPTINNANVNANLCAGENGSFNLSASVSAGYSDPVFQWQQFDGANWQDIVGETSNQTLRTFTNALAGVYRYRLNVAERANIGFANCRISSTQLTINVVEKPLSTVANSGPVCVGSDIQLNAAAGTSFSWSGPNNFVSALQNPQLANVALANAGIYQVTITNAAGCKTTSQTEVRILPIINPGTNISSVEICENTSISLIANGGTVYKWLPAEGLSDSNVANPIASPKETMTYRVTISNGACSATKDILVKVLKNPSADAGADKKIVIGQSVTLDGDVSGDGVTYSWLPTTYLDDPTKLNPTATPPTDMIYTLTVQSNCLTISDQVFVKVYPKIEIANTFTPNGDGINDTWNIPSISAFENPLLKVVNRNGQLVYQNRKAMPWDGKFNNRNLPAGIYYYTLYLNEDYQLYSGWVMLAR